MKAIAILLGNYDEILKAKEEKERLGELPNSEPIPKPQEAEAEFHFALSAVSTCFKTIDGRIKCQIAGMTVCFKWDDDVFNKITTYLKTR